MKKFLFIIIASALCSSYSGSAQSLALHWTKFFGGSLDESIRDAIGTTDGSIVFAGSSNSIDGDIPFSPPDTLGGYPLSVIVGKVDSNKQLVWMKSYGGQQRDLGIRVIQLNDGGYAVLGYTESSDGDVTWNRGVSDLWVLRLDASGDLLWQRTYGSSGHEFPISIGQTSDNGLIILGWSNTFDYDVPVHPGITTYGYNYVVIKTDSVGELIWSKTIGGNGHEVEQGSIFEANGGYYFAGGSTSRDNDFVDTSWCPNTYTWGDAYLLFLDTAGNIQWAKGYGGSEGDDFVNAFWDIRDSTIVMAGRTRSTDFMVTQNYSPQIISIWVVKTDRNGTLLWESRIGDTTTSSDLPAIMPVEGGYLVCTRSSPTQTFHYGNVDGHLFLLDTSGILLTKKVIGGVKGDFVTSVVPYRSGYAAVGFSNSVQFMEGINDNTPYNSYPQTRDIFISGLYQMPLEIKTYSKHAGISLYPNPTTGMFTLETLDNGVAILQDIQGKQLSVYNIIKGKNVLDFPSGIVDGIYILQFKGEKGIVNMRLIKG